MITDYDIRYKKSVSTPSWTNWPHTGTARTATITGLDRGGISYDVEVNAANAQGTGPWSFTASETTPSQAPAAPAAPTDYGRESEYRYRVG